MLHHLEKGFGPIHDEFLDKSKFNIRKHFKKLFKDRKQRSQFNKRQRPCIFISMHACVLRNNCSLTNMAEQNRET